MSDIAIELARKLLPQLKPLQPRVNALESLVRIYRQVEGESDLDLLREGFVLADELRKDGRKTPALVAASPSSPGWASCTYVGADEFENFLIGESARDNFDSAMRFTRSIEDEHRRLRALLSIAQALRQPW